MRLFCKAVLFVSALVWLSSCKSKKTASLAGDEPVEIGDFISFFPEKKSSFQVSDTGLLKKDKDSLLISYKVFTQFVPDSILSKQFGKTKPQLYPMGKLKGEETYLFAKAVTTNKRLAFVLAFDKKDQFIAAMPLLSIDQSPATQQVSNMDKNFTINKTVYRKNADGSTSDGKDVFVLNSEGKNFMLIMTDALEDKVTELINPIDTLPRKQKFSADYGSGAMNLFSFRDGRKPDRISFFIHFEKSNGECTGELKGEAMMKTATRAEYRSPGDPCGLQFVFSGSSVSVKELDACGNHRGLRCSFDGTYARKKELKPKAVKPKKTTSK